MPFPLKNRLIDMLLSTLRTAALSAALLVLGTVAALSQSISYDIEWQAGDGSSASGTVVFNTLSPSCMVTACPEIDSFSLSVGGDAFAKADFNNFYAWFNTLPLDPDDTSNQLSNIGDFNVFAATPGAPNGVAPNTFSYGGQTYAINSVVVSDHTPPGLGLSLSQTELTATRGVTIAPITASATGGDESYSFSVAPALPAGLSLDAASGEITGTPTAAQASASYTLTVTDGTDATETATLTIAVNQPDLGLSLSQTRVTATRGVAISPVTVTVSGGDGHYGFGVSPSLPAGLSLDPGSGRIWGTPSAVQGVQSYTLSVTDGGGRTLSAMLEISVAEDTSRVQEAFEEATSSFMASRAERMLAMEPRGYRFENRRTARGFTDIVARANDDQMMLRFAGNQLSADGRWHVWMEGEYSFTRFDAGAPGQRSGEFGLASAGVDYLVHPRLAFGAMIQVDRAREDGVSGSRISGTGWMVGPYLAGEIAENLYFTLRGAVGDTSNRARIDVFGGGADLFEGTFRSRRMLARASIYGVHRLKSGIEISPEVDLAWIRDRQADYSVSNGATVVPVNGSTVELGRMTLSTLIEIPGADANTIVFMRPAVIWNFHRQGTRQIERSSGSLEIGVRTSPVMDWQGVLALRIDNIGNSGRQARSVRVGMNRRF